MKGLAFAVPGKLTTPTGGYGYARRMITELRARGWETQVLDLGEAMRTDHVRARGLIERAPDGSLQALFPARIDGEAPSTRLPLRR